MRLLALDGASARVSAAIATDDRADRGWRVLAHRSAVGERGRSAALAPLLADLLAERAGALDGIAVVTGPGSFTGLRTALALAHGLAAAAGLRVAGVSVAEALAEAVPDRRGRSLWVAIDSRR